MKTKTPRVREDDVPRPPCSTCGAPATHQMKLECLVLRLQRDAGLRSEPYWTPHYSEGTSISALVCGTCLQASVKISVAVTANVDKAKEKP